MKNKNLINSFKHALAGLKSAFKTERNLKIHVTVATIVVILGIILKLNLWEWIICISWFAIVIGGELFNTAIEITVNLAMPQIHNDAKRAKDISAGGVLIFAIGSAIIGFIVFVPKLLSLFF